MKRHVNTVLFFLILIWIFTIPNTQASLNNLPLFEAFPSLKSKIHHYPLIKSKTPVYVMKKLESHLNKRGLTLNQNLWVKRDDRSFDPLGGNKSRKLEFLLADIIQKKSKTLITAGMYGSNHALATAIAAKKLGLQTKLILGPQPITKNVRQKLLAMHSLGAKLDYHGNLLGLGLSLAGASISNFFGLDSTSYYIPPGGSSELGSIGYVNAFFELLKQFENKPFVDQIIVPVGSGGTAAGLLVGSCLSRQWEKVQIIGVSVVSNYFYSQNKLRQDAEKLYRFLTSHMSDEDRKKVAKCNFKTSKKALGFTESYYQPEYGAANKEVYANINLLKKHEGIMLDPTYSGKAMSYFIDKAQDIKSNKKMLFWLTYNSYPLSKIIDQYQWNSSQEKWKNLPEDFHWIYQN